ncbi:uncharacterized protein LOC106471255 [Limulus polyphemus]|uniref:Uncharacterized protein LOC106471255 n=1 Tax=Limulus polyphemus TaxID=6850 RepID=A0ABM1TI69_LIMPO|nr:uncharacterized protein LOC106471255 [Limulus polyphemus]
MLEYHSMENYLQEGLRLSTRLGIKSALAGLWIGGGKGLISEPPNRQSLQPEFRQKLFFDFGDFVSSLNGCYITGIDIGVNISDMTNVHSRTRWTVSIPGDLGGSVNAANLLGRGIFFSGTYCYFLNLNLNSVFPFLGMNVAHLLLDRDVGHIYITDVSKKRVEDIRDILAHKSHGRVQVEKVPIGDLSILSYKCDILSPCALGHVSNVVFIYVLTQKILKDSLEQNITVVEAANQLAEIFGQQEHPLWPGRTRAIIQGLLDGGWHEGRDFWLKRKNFAFTDFV